MNSDTIRFTFPWSLILTFTKYFGVSNELNSSKISRLWPSSSEGWLCLCWLLTEIPYVHRERESRINVIGEVNVYRILDTDLYGSASKFICRLRDLFAFGKGRAAEFEFGFLSRRLQIPATSCRSRMPPSFQTFSRQLETVAIGKVETVNDIRNM